MPAPLFVALIVVLLSFHLPGAVSRLPVFVLSAPMGLVTVVVVTVRGIVVHMLMVVILPRLHIGRVSTFLGF